MPPSMEDRRHTDRASRHWPRLLALIAADSRGTRMLPRHAARFFVAGLSSRVVSASDCGVRGSRFESRR